VPGTDITPVLRTASGIAGVILLRGKADVREIGPNDSASRKSGVLNDLPVFAFRQSPARNFPNAMALCADHRDQMREDQILGVAADLRPSRFASEYLILIRFGLLLIRGQV
jgi:hypothetical protein